MTTHRIEPITLAGESLEDVISFTYLGFVVDQKGDKDQDVKARIQKARVAFIILKSIFNSNIKAV